jgi:type IV pilus assembly protein PilE
MLTIPMSKNKGFTLIELMIVVAVIAILAAIAYPSYQNYVRQARRADAHEALMRIQLEQEKRRANQSAYTNNLADLNLTATSSDGYYNLAITASSGIGFTATATGIGPQTSDTGCTVLTLTVAAAGITRTPANCWRR